MEAAHLEKLCAASATKSFVPEKDVGWGIPFDTSRPALPSSVISLAGSPEYAQLDEASRVSLAKFELASIFSTFVRFENVINGYLARFAQTCASDDALLPYTLHVMEEEARHSRMFARVINDLRTGPFPRAGVFGVVEALGAAVIRTRPALFYTGVLAVEEITDQVMAAALEAPDLHPTVADVSRIHRIEESRHMDFVREVVRDRYREAGRLEKFLTRVAAPLLAFLVFELLISPAVYRRAGLAANRAEGWALWRRARVSRSRSELRQRAVGRMREWISNEGWAAGVAARLWSSPVLWGTR